MPKLSDEAQKRFETLRRSLEGKKEELDKEGKEAPWAVGFLEGLLEELEEMNLRLAMVEKEVGPGDQFIGIDVPHRLS
jgi:hypothetical protein